LIDTLPSISIVILNYNGEKNLREFLPYVLSIDYPNKEIIVVDGGSHDGSLEYLSQFPNVKVVDQGHVLGGAHAVNVGFINSSGEYILFLGNDMAPNRDILLHLVPALMHDTTVAACGSKILAISEENVFTDLIDHVGLKLDRYGFPKAVGFGEHDRGQYDAERTSWWFGGCEALIRKAVFKDAGGFDESYVGLYDDVDFFWRLRLHGYKIALEPKAVIYHDQPLVHTTTSKRFSRGRIRYYAERNSQRTIIKNYSTFTLITLLPSYIALYVAGISLFILIGRIDLFKADFRALLDNIRDFRSIWKAHLLVQARRIIPDSEILSTLHLRSYKIEILETIISRMSGWSRQVEKKSSHQHELT
jgi:GT2 family glycosyltransferase